MAGYWDWLYNAEGQGKHCLIDDLAKHNSEGWYLSVVEAQNAPQSTTGAPDGENTAEIVCEICGKVCASKLGYAAHLRSHK